MGRSKSTPKQKQQYNDGDDNVDDDRYHNDIHEPVLGRRTLHFNDISSSPSHSSSSSSIHQQQQETHNNYDNDQDTNNISRNENSDEDEEDDVSILYTRNQRVRHDMKTRTDRKQGQQQEYKPSSYPSNLTSLIQRIEANQIEEVKQRRKKRKQSKACNNKYHVDKNNDNHKRKRIVTFASSINENEGDSKLIPLPEIRIIQHEDEEKEEHVLLQSKQCYDIYYNETKLVARTTTTSTRSKLEEGDKSPVLDTQVKDENYWILAEYDITSNCNIVHINDVEQFVVNSKIVDNTISSNVSHVQKEKRLSIVTKQGVIDIWTMMIQHDNIQSSPNSIHCLGRAVEARMLIFELCLLVDQCSSGTNGDETKFYNEIRLRIGLTDLALSLCSPNSPSTMKAILKLKNTLNTIPPSIIYKTKVRNKKKSVPIKKGLSSSTILCYDLFIALSLLFPNSTIVDIFSGTTEEERTSTSDVITARQVYALTDNVQLNHAYKKNIHYDNNNTISATDETLLIPGLLPKLRPYQCKAVEWMLRREHQVNIENNEWQLAWIILSTKKQFNCNTYNPNLHSDTINNVNDLNEQDEYPIFLPRWIADRCSNSTALNQNDDILLFCPNMGWITNSIQDAKVWTIGSSSSSTTGGILAESMGLGKTVEVLACILANPRPQPATVTLVPCNSDNSNCSPIAEHVDHRSTAASSSVMVGDTSLTKDIVTCTNSITYVDDDINIFGDAENDSDVDSESCAKLTIDIVTSENTVRNCINEQDHLTSIPCKASTSTEFHDSQIEERWTEDDVLGACICGDLISFDALHMYNDTIIICRKCNEPMHETCASFASYEEMVSTTSTLRYRHIETNLKLDCRVCDAQCCPCCVENMVSSATLIVTPPAILNQWEREISRHTKKNDTGESLRVVVYDGIKRMSQSNAMGKGCPTIKYIHPRYLAASDIVLTTFDALMHDLGHTDDNQFVARSANRDSSGSLRKRKRYRVVPSPLLSIKWWRVCLDEAQRVETPTAGTAQMALKIDAVHRWCVSGTPIQRGNINDLYGLLLFLRLDPFWDKRWFLKCFNPKIRNVNACIMHLLQNVFWRSTKASELVRIQMGIPEQIEKKIMLKFSSIEKHFYERQLEQTIETAIGVDNRSTKSSKKEALRLHSLTEKLYKLRAACCHPQVGSSGICSIRRSRQSNVDSSLNSRVMTMNQILDKFIDDAKIQCEESQRLVVLHTNGMAATSRLKVEAKQRGVKIAESDLFLLENSCKLYNEALHVADENGTPTLVYGEVALGGSSGFRSHGRTMDMYSFCLDWQRFDIETAQKDIWAKFYVANGSSRKLTQVKARLCRSIPDCLLSNSSVDIEWEVLFPKDCTFQSMTTSGEFTDVCSFSLPQPDESDDQWIVSNGFRTNKSKEWRVIVDTFHSQDIVDHCMTEVNTRRSAYIGIELECFEANIASDPLQRLHCLHNASQAYASLLQLVKDTPNIDESIGTVDVELTTKRITEMSNEALKIESLYLHGVRTFHRDSVHRLMDFTAARVKLERELQDLSSRVKSSYKKNDCWDELWWDDFLVVCLLHGNEIQQRSICDKIKQDLEGMIHERWEGSTQNSGLIMFPMFRDLSGLRTALQLRIKDVRSGIGIRSSRRSQQSNLLIETSSIGLPVTMNTVREGRFRCTINGHQKCMQSILAFTEYPSQEEIHENSHCHVCKADWFQAGPKCRICEIGDTLEELTPDKVSTLLLNSLHAIVKGSIGTSLLRTSGDSALISNRAKIFFDVLEASRKERTMAYRVWRTHLNLLNDIDELNQCKSTMRLAEEGEDFSSLTKDLQNSVIEPVDVNTAYHQYAAKQVMALGALSRAKGTLKYLKNLSAVERQNRHLANNDDENCLVCLCKFDTERAVLRCGHCFHLSPCLEKLRARSVGTTISCPLRCNVRTAFNEVMISSEGKRHDDGSHSRRIIRGSYGTKVTRLVNDVLDICEIGEKGLVFSQWDDMLDICFHALSDNGIRVVRTGSSRELGKCTRRFQEPDCNIMLLNIKNGAEGLTLVEATHVFMLEPLLNCGLDNQAINRVHRIGQNSKTYVWRYIVEDTVEVKIDLLRLSHQEDQLEDSVGDGKKSMIQAGGIDGGFHSQEELLDILQS